MKLPISPRGYWLAPGFHTFDKKLAAGIAEALDCYGVETVIDIGCGDGSYTRYLLNGGFDCMGYDGNPHTPEVTGGLCGIADFSEPQDLGLFDAVVCLEVGEHVPAEFEGILLDNIAGHACDVIVLSWAIPKQGGDGHVNERSNEYIMAAMLERGWMIEASLTKMLRGRTSNAYWFQNTIMVFVRSDATE